MQYFQVIPVYMKDDLEAFNYFGAFKTEIDQITGTAIVVLLPEKIETGDASGAAELFRPGSHAARRFPGLKRMDLPCLILEDGDRTQCVIKIGTDRDSAKDLVRALADESAAAATANDLADRVRRALDQNFRQRSGLMLLIEEVRAMTQDTDRRIAILAGIAFLVALLVLAVFIKNPTPFQYVVFKSVLAVAGAAFAVAIPGILDITLGRWLKASGALAVLVLLYYFSPAALVTTP